MMIRVPTRAAHRWGHSTGRFQARRAGTARTTRTAGDSDADVTALDRSDAQLAWGGRTPARGNLAFPVRSGDRPRLDG